ncbi:hypothetical protein O7606_01320 [Micromonospora sp. WMMD882]|uniref:hypothetical protein n=1 Tax=Micromonospora sp. WMMD882 TaxID=3015151 RepID=UPI00248BB7FB|nr:hypothetical protein [Micromonospora sp. WMMD882]WBB80067.1 hypothetical protein O7606_01320 [Micromonospora sp. WMMD882]
MTGFEGHAAFEEYAALARELSARRRAAAHAAAAEAHRLRVLHDTLDQLDRRLAEQHEWLTGLGAAIGVPGPPAGDVPPPAEHARVLPYREHPERPALPDVGPAARESARLPVSRDPLSHRSAPSAPVFRDPAPSAPASRDPAPLDPAEELALVRRRADDADRHGRRAEELAGRPRLLPGWSPQARAAVVYLGCVVVGVLAAIVLGHAYDTGRVDGFTLGAWIAAGLPALVFFAGFLLLGRYGRPVLGGAPAPRNAKTGFLLCFLLVPLGYCGYLTLLG